MAKAKTPRNGASKSNGEHLETPVAAAQLEAKPKAKPKARKTTKALSEVRKNVVPINLDEEIRRRAYELWEQRGYEPGHEHEHWLSAEREILSRYRQESQHSA
jgi:Protein of unknown function (DUF2934)